MFPTTKRKQQQQQQQQQLSFLIDSNETPCKETISLSYCCQTLKFNIQLILELGVVNNNEFC